jgi:hypothetical protein
MSGQFKFGGGDGIEVGNHKLTDGQFECESCHQVFEIYLSVSKDTEVRGYSSFLLYRQLLVYVRQSPLSWEVLDKGGRSGLCPPSVMLPVTL